MSSIVLHDGSKLESVPIDVTADDRRLIVSNIKVFLLEFAQYVKDMYGLEIFGEDHRNIIHNHAFVGSSANLVNYVIPDEEFALYKPRVGDIDVQVPDECKDAIKRSLEGNKTFNGYRILGFTNHGNETSVLIADQFEGPFQIDFEYVDFGNTSMDHKFLHSSSWEDTRHGFKGVHHKLLLNAIGLEHYKFSVTHGLRYRNLDHGDTSIGTPEDIAMHLFGLRKTDSDFVKMHSFVGLTDLINDYISHEEEDPTGQIFDKFVNDCKSKTKIESGPAIEYLEEHLNLYEY